MDTTETEASQVIVLLNQGLKQSEVAEQLNLSQSAVSRVYQKFTWTGRLAQKPGCGRPRCTSRREDHFIVAATLRDRHRTGVDIQQQLMQDREQPVSSWTVRRRLKEANLTPKRPTTGPKLTGRDSVLPSIDIPAQIMTEPPP
ncbi:uncharacterized protein LOC134805197 [Cydia splendana]|uniref:uncharacterized protein LOC134805197 n=1 Tax=Cydia splendana TaxID=1100963 RepID=UPI00300D12E5